MTLASDIADIYADMVEAGLSTDTVTVTTDGVPSSCTAIIRYGKGDEYKGSDGYGVNATLRIQAQGDVGVATITRKTTITIAADTWRVIGADKSSTGLEWIIQANKVTS
jgi:hypothetical protein